MARRKTFEVIEDRLMRGIGIEYPKYMAVRWKQRQKKLIKVCKYSADEFFALSDKKQTEVYNALRDVMTELSFDMQFIESKAYIAKKKHLDDVRREAIRLQNVYGEATGAEARKNAYMKEANGMRVERQIILRKLVEIQRLELNHYNTRRDDLNNAIVELITQLQKDPERL
jgi:hypothetical protein